MAITPVVEVELSGAGSGWTDITGDVLLDRGTRGTRGNHGVRLRDRLADTGVLRLSLINSPANSGGLEGYYSPRHANLRSGFAVNIGIRVRVVIGVTSVTFFTGIITKIEPTAGQFVAPRLSVITATDYMDRLANHRLSGLATTESTTEVGLFDLIIAEMPVQPTGTATTAGKDTYPFAFDQIKDEATAPLTELQRLANSAYAVVYVRGDGTVVYEPRTTRGTVGSVDLALTDADFRNSRPPRIQDRSNSIINRVLAVSTPRRIDTANKVLAQLQTIHGFAPGAHILRLLFTDPDQRSTRIGGKTMVTPASTTDFLFNSQADGAGTDLTAQCTVTAVYSSNSAVLTITNNSTSTAYAGGGGDTSGVLLQVRGLGVYPMEKVTLEASDSASIALIGENVESLQMPYLADLLIAQDSADFFLHIAVNDDTSIDTIPIWLDPNDEARALLIAQVEISDRISVTETQTGLAAKEYYVNAVDFEIDNRGFVWIKWTPITADVSKFWFLEVAGASELGQTTWLGFDYVAA